MADLSVIVSAYTLDRWEQLVEAVRSVQAQSLMPREIIVVADHNPALLERVRTALPEVTSIANSQTRGLAGARNSGIAKASGEIIVFLDDDAIADRDWLRSLLEGYAEPSVAGVGGAIAPLWEAGRPAWFPEEFDWVVGCTYLGMPACRAPVRNLIGANMSFRRDVVATTEGFRTGIGRIGTRPLGCEETELCIRIRQQRSSASFQYEPSARVVHRVPAARGRWAYFRARCFAEGLSKATVAGHVGSGDGLASERAYVARALPLGVLRGLKDALGGDRWGLARAGAIALGLAVTTAGYLVGTVGRAARRSAAEPSPAWDRATESRRPDST